MNLTMLKAKLHRVTVTEANLNYVGSITIDSDLMAAANILPNEQVHVVDNNNGSRLVTYAIPGPAGSGVSCLNGSAARLVLPGAPRRQKPPRRGICGTPRPNQIHRKVNTKAAQTGSKIRLWGAFSV